MVEDDNISRTVILTGLRELGVQEVHAFDSCLSALAAVPDLNPHLILSDVHMQPMGGIEFVRKLRDIDCSTSRSIPVIFISADSSASTVSETWPLGVSGYLVKPLSLANLASKIEGALA